MQFDSSQEKHHVCNLFVAHCNCCTAISDLPPPPSPTCCRILRLFPCLCGQPRRLLRHIRRRQGVPSRLVHHDARVLHVLVHSEHLPPGISSSGVNVSHICEELFLFLPSLTTLCRWLPVVHRGSSSSWPAFHPMTFDCHELWLSGSQGFEEWDHHLPHPWKPGHRLQRLAFLLLFDTLCILQVLSSVTLLPLSPSLCVLEMTASCSCRLPASHSDARTKVSPHSSQIFFPNTRSLWPVSWTALAHSFLHTFANMAVGMSQRRSLIFQQDNKRLSLWS